jgi:alkanesulfonate monooxygenase SsuD/methylene tetrahydromethanopterin reductase-like flavin-dependent oxidoreductase (luciferase family)
MSPLHFNVFIGPNGFHESAWRAAPDDAGAVLGLPYYAEIGRIAEGGLLDSVFLADNMAVPAYRVTHQPQTQFDPTLVLAALAAVTSRIGLIGTGSTTYSYPWDLARRFATLDQLSGGRAGWNIVTTRSPLAAANFGRDSHPEHDDRYDQAYGFVDVVQRSWDSETGGSPQGWPVLVQAGQSPAGIALAARYAELAFSSPASQKAAVTYRTELRRQAAAAGRGQDLPLVLPGLMITLGGTEAEAQARARELDDLVSPEFRAQNLLYMAGLDPDAYDPAQPLPAELYDGHPQAAGRAKRLYDAAREHPDLPLRELAGRLTRGSSPVHFTGTPQQLTEFMIAWQDAGAADGFTLLGSTLPRELRAFADHVVPLLQARGRFRTAYSGPTLRDHLGLARPPRGSL